MNLSADLNRDLRRTVKSFNQKVRRAERKGQTGLPQLRSVRELKAQFTTESDLKREVGMLRSFLNNKEALQRKKTADGTISNWEFDYIANNLKSTKAWVDRQIDKTSKRLKDYPEHLYSIRADLNKLEAEKEIINRNLNKLTARELRTVGTVVNRMKRENLKTRAGREYFMDNLNQLLRARGTNKDVRTEVINKLNNLTNEQFLELYRTHDIISEVMTKLPSETEPVERDEKLDRAKHVIATDDEIIELLDNFVEDIDDYIEEVTQ